MIPYVHVPEVCFACFTFDAVSVLTVAGLIVALMVAHRRARRLGIDAQQLNSFVAWLLVGALLGGHLAEVSCYRCSEIATFADGHVFWQKPWKLLWLWDGWRSVGGFFGAILSALLWRKRRLQITDWWCLSRFTKLEGYWLVSRERAEPILKLSDLVLSVFPLAWLFNRAGSALIHDHPGRRAASADLFAVAFPALERLHSFAFGVVHGRMPRYDLGLLELLVTALLLIAVFEMWKRPLRTGSYVCFVGLTYPLGRFAIDFLHPRTGAHAEPLYAALTPAQWGCLLLFSLTVLLWLRIRLAPIEHRVRA